MALRSVSFLSERFGVLYREGWGFVFRGLVGLVEGMKVKKSKVFVE